MRGLTPRFSASRWNLTIANRLPWSVRATAGMPAAATACMSRGTRTMPSTSEYSVCSRRWTNAGLPARAKGVGMREYYRLGARNCAGEGGRGPAAQGSRNGPRSGSPCAARNRSPDRAPAMRVMKASRAVLARIDAALISPTRASPPITASKSQSRPSMRRSGQRLPSTQTRPGATASPRSARRIASSVACRMFSTSISAASTQPMAQAIASSRGLAPPVARASAASVAWNRAAPQWAGAGPG